MKVNGAEKEFIIDTGSPISKMLADDNILKRTEIEKVNHRYRDVSKNEVEFLGQIPVDIEYANIKQKVQIMITKRNGIPPLLGMDWLKKLDLTIRNIRLDENNQSEKNK